MDNKLQPQEVLERNCAYKKLALAAKVSEDVARAWSKKQAIWHTCFLAPRHVPRPKFSVSVPNEMHQAVLPFLPHDRVRRKTYKCALTMVHVASRYKEAEPLTSKESTEVANLQSWATEIVQTTSGRHWA